MNGGLTNSLAAAFVQWSVPAGEAVTPGDAALSERMVHFLSSEIGAEAERILRLRTLHAEFAGLHGQAGTDQERQRLILNFARDLGADDSMIEGDRKAFSRWFGRDAVTDRCRRRVALAERKISFCLNRIGSIARRLLKEQADAAGARGLWRRLAIEKVVRDFFVYDGDSRVCVEAFRTLTDAPQGAPRRVQRKQRREHHCALHLPTPPSRTGAASGCRRRRSACSRAFPVPPHGCAETPSDPARPRQGPPLPAQAGRHVPRRQPGPRQGTPRTDPCRSVRSERPCETGPSEGPDRRAARNGPRLPGQARPGRHRLAGQGRDDPPGGPPPRQKGADERSARHPRPVMP
ncbi:MAG: hypothetical protein MZV70_13735 [Desulfobacterales bacterium]|nr:hypothetical protein [Desulfobacterales bacterium]